MKLQFLALESLCVSPLNMRHGRKQPDIANLLPSVRKRGILQPLLVRPLGAAFVGTPRAPGGGSDDGGSDYGGAGGQGQSPDNPVRPSGPTHEILAGRRRYHAARLIAREAREAMDSQDGSGTLDDGGDDGLLIEDRVIPCAILEEGDDAAALEASLLENAARLDPDEVTRWESFVRLMKAGRDVDEIADMFALPQLTVRRIFALGNLLPRIRTLYAREEIDRATVRHLTLATKRQQRDWLALWDDAQQRAPTGHNLRLWLLGGTAIAVRHAWFDVAASGLETRADLFGEDAYFVDPDGFWAAQQAQIEARRADWLAAGWRDVILVPPQSHFAPWEHEKCPKRKGGRIYVDIRASGEIVVHEAYVRRGEKRAGEDSGQASAAKPARPEMSASLAAYVDLHRHAAVRVELLERPQIALRLMLAHVMAGAPFWHVHADPATPRRADTAEALAAAPAMRELAARRAALLSTLGLPDDEAALCDLSGGEAMLLRLFHHLLDLPDEACLAVMAMVMSESLACGSATTARLGVLLGVDMGKWWRGDAVLPALVRDRELLLHLLDDVAGPVVADAHGDAKGTTLRTILTDHLCGTNGRSAPTGWVPRWMAFPPAAYTARGGVPMVEADARACAALAEAPEEGDDKMPDGEAARAQIMTG
ncbi:MAG: chromosome partitioning protein ParB [Pseudomonadota bacterium]